MVEIVPYNENWPAEFQAIAAALRQGLGELALRIDHVGSTSVPGLPAKDLIDIQITVAALDEQLIATMAALGYPLREGLWHDDRPPLFPGPESEWDKLLFHGPPDGRRMNIHARVGGRANQRYALLFRDYLRGHPASAAAYADLKRLLAQHLADLKMYPDVKGPAMHLIHQAAEAWARTTGWRPGLADA
jgi:GrpB-like predicted nucleotidyltransferase (UPF0157 family)